MKRKAVHVWLMAMALVWSVPSFGQKIKGSDTCLPLTQLAAENYMNAHPEAMVVVTGGGSGVGLSALRENMTDIAMTSRKIKFDEQVELGKEGKRVEEVIIAYDALAVIVHPSNPVKELTREQLEKIFTGRIRNWKEVGGPDRRIVAYSRETSSGTYEFFKESVLKNKNYTNRALSMPATGAVIQSISQTKGAIGYVGLAYLNDAVKALSVSYDGGAHFVTPTFENAEKKLYPIVRPLYYYYEEKNEARVNPFIHYLLSPEGQNVVREKGYIPVGSDSESSASN